MLSLQPEEDTHVGRQDRHLFGKSGWRSPVFCLIPYQSEDQEIKWEGSRSKTDWKKWLFSVLLPWHRIFWLLKANTVPKIKLDNCTEEQSSRGKLNTETSPVAQELPGLQGLRLGEYLGKVLPHDVPILILFLSYSLLATVRNRLTPSQSRTAAVMFILSCCAWAPASITCITSAIRGGLCWF